MDDRDTMRALVNQLRPELLEEYNSYGSLTLESAFPGRRLVVFRVAGDKPTNVQTMTFGDMLMRPNSGPEVTVFAPWLPEPLTVGMVPVKVPGREIFLQMPQKFEFRWKGRNNPSARPGEGVHFAPHYAVLIKSRSKPHLKTDGHELCVRLNQFREMYPDA